MNCLQKQNQLARGARAAISFALAEYEADEHSSAKKILVALSCEANQTPAPNPIAWVSWVELAIDRLDQHLGKDVIAFSPVTLCLNTAFSLIPEPKDGDSHD